MESYADRTRAFLQALAFHAAIILMAWFGFDWLMPTKEVSAAGEPIKASLEVASSDLKRASAAIAAAEKAQPEEKPETPAPQPIPEPRPEASDTPVQPLPQARQDQPDTVDQEAISRLALERAEQLALQEQEQRTREEQVELTEDIKRQQEVERKQRLRDELIAIRREREAATKNTRLEEQRLAQLADIQSAKPSPSRATPAAPAGDRGVDEGLLARYMSAMKQTADENWNHIGALQLTHCIVRFTQLPGGIVRGVEFLNCPFGAEGREFVERALKKTPMPYSGFETVFSREVKLDFCYPKEECTR